MSIRSFCFATRQFRLAQHDEELTKVHAYMRERMMRVIEIESGPNRSRRQIQLLRVEIYRITVSNAVALMYNATDYDGRKRDTNPARLASLRCSRPK